MFFCLFLSHWLFGHYDSRKRVPSLFASLGGFIMGMFCSIKFIGLQW